MSNENKPDSHESAQRDQLLQAAIDFIGTLTGLKPPPIEVAPPEVFAPFYAFVERVQEITRSHPEPMVVQHARASADRIMMRCMFPDPDAVTREQLTAIIEGMSVSVDVSTGDHDAGHRYFGTVTEVMESTGDKHQVTLLVQDAKPNFEPQAVEAQAPAAVAVPDVLRSAFLKGWDERGKAHDLSPVPRHLVIEFMDEVFPEATPERRVTEDSSAGDLAEGPAGSGGWKVHAERMEKECAHWKTLAETMRAHACKDVWYWQGDGSDNPQSMVNSLAVVIRADQLRDLLAQPQAEPALYVSRGQLENHTDPDRDGGRYLPARRTPLGLLNYPLYTAPQAQPAFQQRVQPWMMACFGAEIAADRIERNHRFLEEALELVQSTGCTQSEAHQLVDYVFGRPVGEPAQEVGGVMVTLAALCLANGLDMHQAGETELARVWTKVEAIRAKQAAKPKHSPLPLAQPADALTPAHFPVPPKAITANLMRDDSGELPAYCLMAAYRSEDDARAALAALATLPDAHRDEMTRMVDAAMVATANISPALRRIDCQRVISAALAVIPQAPQAQPADALDAAARE